MSHRKKRLFIGLFLFGIIVIFLCGGVLILQGLDVLPTFAELNETATAKAWQTQAVITPSATATITDTPEPTATATITDTPMPTATPDPEDVVRGIIADVLGRNREILDVQVNEGMAIVAHWMMIDSWGDLVGYTETEMVKVACDLRATGLFDGLNYQFIVMAPFSDSYGNINNREAVGARLLPTAIAQINCDHPELVNIEFIAQYYNVHPALR